MKSFNKIGYVVVLMANYPNNTLIETHVFHDTRKGSDHQAQVKKVLSGWMQGKDKMVKLETAQAKKKTITPYVIETEDGEDCDIFAQLIL